MEDYSTNILRMEDKTNSSSKWRKSSFIDKLKHILTHSIMTDLTIRLINGVDIKECNVHSLFLVMASEVFEKMVQSSFKEGLTKIIEMKNVKPEVFELLLSYVYGQPLNITNLDHIKDLTQLADYYMMDGLKTEIISFCESQETPDIACIGIEVAESCEEPLLKNNKLQYIMNNTQSVVNHQNFLKASAETIKTVLDQDYLKIEEIDLFKAIEKWIKHNIVATEESVKEILIRKIRYFSMTPQDFVCGPVSSKLLKPEDVVSLLSHFVDGNSLIPLPEGFTEVKRSYSQNYLMLTSLPSLIINKRRSGIDLRVTKQIWLTHLIIYPLITDKEYEETIQVEHCLGGSNEQIAIFEGKVTASDNIEVKLNIPLQLEVGGTCKMFVSFTPGNRKCVYLSNHSEINNGDISFSFQYWFSPECPIHSIKFNV